MGKKEEILSNTGLGEDARRWGGYPKSAWGKDSYAVVVSDSRRMIVLYTGGPAIKMELDESGMAPEDILPIEGAGDGISVWVGKAKWEPGPYDCTEDGETILDGEFRDPTDQEWEYIRKGESPWNEADWGWVEEEVLEISARPLIKA